MPDAKPPRLGVWRFLSDKNGTGKNKAFPVPFNFQLLYLIIFKNKSASVSPCSMWLRTKLRWSALGWVFGGVQVSCTRSVKRTCNASAIFAKELILMFWSPVRSIREIKLTDKPLASASFSCVTPNLFRATLIFSPTLVIISHLLSI